MLPPRLLASLLTVPVLALLSVRAVAQRDFEKVEITITPVAGNVSMLEGLGGNVGVSIGEDGTLIVDDQFGPLAEKIQAAISSAGGGTPRFVINTHFHGDHTGGNAIFGEDGTIIAHENVRRRLIDPPLREGRRDPPAPPAALPVITFTRSVTLHWNGEEVRVLHLPHGHTDTDSVMLFLGSGVAHLGDDFFVGRFPYVDVDTGGDVLGLMRNVDRLLAELPADVQLIPGHGPLATLEDLRAYRAMLQATVEIVRERMAEGAKADEVIAAGLPDEWAEWGTGFISTERWLGIVHTSLTRSPEGPPLQDIEPTLWNGPAAAAGAAGGAAR
ncbi:MAG: MBL fold metallo-hydrolase [Planctomycetota bacterium]|jgi:glyoxylase-like metal-dependent hydrolase (beta-lactamase superfamily II)